MSAALQNVLLITTAAIGLYGSLVKYASESSALYFLLTIVAIVVYFDKLAKIPEGWKRVYTIVGVLLATTFAIIGWVQGGLHRLAETLVCDLSLPGCSQLRNARIAHSFKPVEFSGFHSDVVATRFCVAQGATNAVAFRLENSTPNAYSVSYQLRALTKNWKPIAHDPLLISGKVDVGRMDAQDRITRSPIRFESGPGVVAVRVCFEPSEIGPLDRRSFSSEGAIDIVDVATSKQ